MTDTPEFSRLWRLDELGEAPRAVTLTATAEECSALAKRFGLVAIDRLTAEASLTAAGTAVTADGRMTAAVTQACVVSGEPVSATIDAPFTLKFMPAGTPEAGAEIELSEADCDVIDYDGGAIDLGEAVAETLALELDPFPRSPKADEVLKAAGISGEAEGGAFAGLKALLERKQ